MDSLTTPQTQVETGKKTLTVKAFGIGTAGTSVLERIIGAEFPAANCVAINTDPQVLAGSSAAERIHLETKRLRGLGTGGDPDRGRALAQEQTDRLKNLCAGADVILLATGLGGGAGTGISPVLVQTAKAAGALVLAFVMTPFECEGSRRRGVAEEGLQELKELADGVICLPNQKVIHLIDEHTSVADAFKLADELLADAMRATWRLLRHSGLIEIHVEDVCALLRDRHSESAFATAEAVGADRAAEVVGKLLAHPLLEGGAVFAESEAVLVSMMGGPDLTMAEVNRVMEMVNAKCARIQVIMGATIDEVFRGRLAVTLICARARLPLASAPAPGTAAAAENLDTQLLSASAAGRPKSRLLPPPPELSPQEMEKLMARQRSGSGRARKAAPRLRQTHLPLEIVSKGRFDKSEPTIHKGEDLDVPTYIRRGVPLN